MMVERQNSPGDIVGEADGSAFSFFGGLGKFFHVSMKYFVGVSGESLLSEELF